MTATSVGARLQLDGGAGLLGLGQRHQLLARALAEDAKAPRVGEMVVGRPARQLEQLVEHLPLDAAGAEGLVRAARADSLLDVHGAER